MEQTVSWPGWETVRLIGRGSFGAVYEIQRTLFGEVEKAALKVITIPQNASDIEELRSDGFDEESITDTFKNHLKSIVSEYSLMRKMNGCTNIVNCDDVRYVQHADGIGWDIYIKMELLTPLTKALPDAIPESTVIKIASDLCTALELCERFDIVHRDIKPQNIFVSDIGDYKLGDFGIAKTVEKTMGGTKIGTYKYMAPEVYNNQPYGSAADIYSLGLVLYWLLNERRMPFLPLPPTKLSAGMDEAARTRRLSGEPIPAPKHGSEGLKRIVLKACAYEPKERYTDAHQMKEALNHLTGAAEAAEEAAAPAFRAAKEVPVRPSKEEAEESEATVVSPSRENVPEREDKHAPPSAPKKRRGPLIAAVCVIVGLLAGGSVFFLGKGSKQPEIAGPTTGATTEATTEAPTEDETARLDSAYAAAEQLLQDGEYDQAIAAFEALNGYKDSAAQIEIARQKSQYAEAEALVQSGKTAEAAMAFYKLGDRQRSFALWDEIAARDTISTGYDHTVGLIDNGTVVAAGNTAVGRCNVSGWTDIVAISTDSLHTVGLRSDGTVVATGYSGDGRCNVSDWTDIVAVSAGANHTVGLKADGTVVAVGKNNCGQCDVSDWTGIVAISAGGTHTVGLKADGTVVVTELIADASSGYVQWDVSDWTDIVAVSACGICVGLKADGTVVATEGTAYAQDISSWTDIVAVSTRGICAGLKADGTLVTAGNGYFGECDVGDWKDIVAVSSGSGYTIGLKADGTVVAVGKNDRGQCDVTEWKNIKLPPISEERQAKLDAARQAFEAQQAADYAAAEKLYQAGNYDQAIAAFEALGEYSDSADWVLEVRYAQAGRWLSTEKYDKAITAFEALNGYKDSAAQIAKARQAQQDAAEREQEARLAAEYAAAEKLYQAGNYDQAIAAFEALEGYSDCADRILEVRYAKAEKLLGLKPSDVACYEEDGLFHYYYVFSTTTVKRKAVGNTIYVNGEFTWSSAAELCQEYGGRIAKIQNTNQQQFIFNWIRSSPAGKNTVYFDLSDQEKEGNWTYSDGTSATYFNWHSGEPNGGRSENYAAFYPPFSDGSWIDGNFKEDVRYFICEWITQKQPIVPTAPETRERNTISAGSFFSLGLRIDGTVVAVGENKFDQCNVSDWKDIVAISAGGNHSVGLKADGTVVAVGRNESDECNVSGWKDIVAVSAGAMHTVGLKSDGTVVAVGRNMSGQCDINGWKDIVAISAGSMHTVGLKSDGTVVAVGENKLRQCDVSGWKDIVTISAGGNHTVGLKSDGTVVAVGTHGSRQCDVISWKDIVAISAGGYHTVGLKANGTVVAVGNNEYGQCDVSGWKDIVAISAGSHHTVGLKADGTVVAVGSASNGQRDVAEWKDIKLPCVNDSARDTSDLYKPGTILRLGRYEQDGNISNGKEEIEWYVIAKDGSRLLLLSRYALEAGKPYNNSYTKVTWENSSIRKWLNGSFYNESFSDEEKRCILCTSVENEDNPYYGTEGGPNTNDSVFLISITELYRYAHPNYFYCEATQYAQSKGAEVFKTGNSPWFLRTIGGTSVQASFCHPNGTMYGGGTEVNNRGVTIRPSLWVIASAVNELAS